MERVRRTVANRGSGSEGFRCCPARNGSGLGKPDAHSSTIALSDLFDIERTGRQRTQKFAFVARLHKPC
jgi:hypothetical protein